MTDRVAAEAARIDATKRALEQETQALLEEFRNTGAVDRGGLEAVTRLGRLLREQERGADSRHVRRNRWYFVWLLAATLTMLISLSNTRVSRAHAQLTVVTDEVSLTTTGENPSKVTDTLALDQLVVGGLSKLVNDDTFELVESTSLKLARSGAAGALSGGIWLSPITVRPGNRLSFTVIRGQPGMQFNVAAAGCQASVLYQGGTTVSPAPKVAIPDDTVAAGVQAIDDDHAPPHSLTFMADTELSLAVTPIKPNTLVAQGPLRFQRISFEGHDYDHVDNQLFDRDYSAIRSVEARFDDRPGETIKVPLGQWVTVTGTGTIREIRRNDNGPLELELDADLTRLTIGPPDAERDELPSRMDWLVARHGAITVWSCTVYLFGLLLAAARWWGMKL